MKAPSCSGLSALRRSLSARTSEFGYTDMRLPRFMKWGRVDEVAPPGAGPGSDARVKRRLGQKPIVRDLRGGKGQPEVEPQVVGQAAQVGEHVLQAGLVAQSLMIAVRPEQVRQFVEHLFSPLRFQDPSIQANVHLSCRRGDQRSVSDALRLVLAGLTTENPAPVQAV